MSGSRVLALVALCTALLLVAGCGDSEVCGVYNPGDIGVVKKCDTNSDGTVSELNDQPLVAELD